MFAHCELLWVRSNAKVVLALIRASSQDPTGPVMGSKKRPRIPFLAALPGQVTGNPVVLPHVAYGSGALNTQSVETLYVR